MKKPQLEKCPYCGNREVHYAFNSNAHICGWVECYGCGARSAPVYGSYKEIAEKWNRRVKDDNDRADQNIEKQRN